jgi:pimeloyl-ACP methyl ester carboxylesterase
MGISEMDAPRRVVAEAQDAFLAEAGVSIRSTWIELEGGLKVHALEAGEGEPLILLHGSNNSSASWVPLLQHARGRRIIAVDRPGYGRSAAVRYRRSDFRQTAVRYVTDLLDALRIESADIVGNSTGSVWTLWTAIDEPTRVRSLTLVGATPLLPGTTPGLPFRIMTTPVLGGLLAKLMPDPSPESVTKMMGIMGEGDTIGRYPKLLDVFVAASSDPVAGEASQGEMSAMIKGLAGFRRQFRFTEEDLERVHQPVLLIWGDHDPIGDLSAAAQARDAFPKATLEVVPTDHAPWWGQPETTASLITEFLETE